MCASTDGNSIAAYRCTATTYISTGGYHRADGDDCSISNDSRTHQSP
jgi:hypothetical protein